MEEFDRDKVSRQTGFEGSVGNNTLNSNNSTGRFFNHEKRAVENAKLRQDSAEKAREIDELQARIRALEAQASRAQMQSNGSPHVSGSPAAGVPQEEIDPGVSAAGQG